MSSQGTSLSTSEVGIAYPTPASSRADGRILVNSMMATSNLFSALAQASWEDCEGQVSTGI
jgi:hypothetical protein